MDYLRTALTRNVTARKKLDSGQFIDIDYRDLTTDPIACVRRVYEAAGTSLSDDTEKHIVHWYEEQAKTHKKSIKHMYSLEDYGLNEDEVNETFKEYNKFNARL